MAACHVFTFVLMFRNLIKQTYFHFQMKNSGEKIIKTIVLESPKYPNRLKQIRHAPKKIYYIGKREVLGNEFFLAVVGTRRATPYGKRASRFILPEIARRKIVIVSGLAKGIDVLAHQIALENDCPTVAVLAGGIDEIYPPEHKNIAQEIVRSGGLILSEHPPGTEYLKQHFPARNRIISGLSQAVLVVEAGEKSGALITACFAAKQERKVFAVPGSVFSPECKGVNRLFARGALPVRNSDDILDFYFPQRRRKGRIAKKLSRDAVPKISLTEEEKTVLGLISLDVPTSLGKIIRESKLPSSQVMAVVSQLEIRSLVENAAGANYVRRV